ncbi:MULTISPECIES: hypothetical protein [Streptomyces]|uniref:Uncharacterized protein n=2 Tax=Streptomyces TaxID=1883 RepID=A0A124C4P0_STRSC|nr:MULTISPECIES: hypothetical protein [Streptomyces]MBE1594238.1 hypothetical protein [Streptomyces stelliscabiei]MDX2521181.1 hypothetical protein [Streptomyces stelliscabiei]MDX2836331.1 hypothetical protein [Streptomyces scabiei]MDX3276169.1 hypothetical protein [Streptomyces scabiei]MDX3681124.1 hypothetical protein [Streptomyces scabiei]
MNTDALEFALLKAERRVLEMQTKLHCWATGDRDPNGTTIAAAA